MIVTNIIEKVGKVHGLIREEGSFGANPGTKDLARHLYSRMYGGKVVIVADKPEKLICTLRKQWLKLMRNVQKERARTLDTPRIQELTSRVAHMKALGFTASWYDEDEAFDDPCDVHIATVNQLLRWPPDCRTMYVTCDLELEKLHMITAWMPKGSLVVMCKLAHSSVK